MGLRGSVLKDEFFFKPNLTRAYSYHFSTNAGFTQDYEGYVRMHNSPADLTPYVELDKYYWEDVPTGALMPFLARVRLPEKIDIPGIHDIRVGIRETRTIGGGTMGVRTAAEGRIIVIVLRPDAYLESEFSAPNANANSTMMFLFNVRNLGEPDLAVRGRVSIYAPDSDVLLGVAVTNSTRILSTKDAVLRAPFSTTGLNPGTYRARAVLSWGENTTEFNRTFEIGSRNVLLLKYTTEYRTKAINKAEFFVQSKWNSPFRNVFAEVRLLNEIDQVMGSFKTVSSQLNAWDSVILTGYFDTSDYSEGIYHARIIVYFDDSNSVYDAKLNISDTSSAITVTEVPKEKSGGIPWMLLLVICIAILVAAIIILVIVLLRRA